MVEGALGPHESLDAVNRVEAATYVRTDSENTMTDLRVTVVPPSLAVGDVLQLVEVPSAGWDRVTVDVYKRRDDSGRGDVWGVFDRSSLRVGEWTWAKSTSIFERVVHCDLRG